MRSVKWDSKVEEFEAQSSWGGAKRDMAVVRAKLGCKTHVSESYSPPRVWDGLSYSSDDADE